MKFLADENIPLDVIIRLKNNGFDIISLTLEKLGIQDSEVLSLALKQNRVLITFDRDFGEIVFKLKMENNGVILLKIHPQSVEDISAILQKILSKKINFSKTFCVVELNRIRVIPLP